MRIRVVAAVALLFACLSTAAQAQNIEWPASPAPYPFASLFAKGHYWVTSDDVDNPDAIGTIAAVNRQDGTLAAGPFSTGGRNPSGLAFDGSSIWVGHHDDLIGQAVVSKLDAQTGKQLLTIGGFEHVTGLAFDDRTGSIWVNDRGANSVTKLRASDGAVLLIVTDGIAGPMGNFFDGTNLWIANFRANSVTKIDTDGNVLGRFVTGSSPAFIDADADGNLWVTNGNDNTVTKLSAEGTVLGTFRTGSSPRGIKFDGTYIWVANTGEATITRLNPSDGSTAGTFRAPRAPRFIAADRNGTGLVTRPPATAITAAQAGISDPCAGGVFDLTGTTASCTFSSPGYYEFVLPDGVWQELVQVYGAQGGTAGPFSLPSVYAGVPGGLGAYAGGTTSVTPGYAMLITVGGRGGDGVNNPRVACGPDWQGFYETCGGVGGAGGYNGGAPGGKAGDATCCSGLGGNNGGNGGGGGGGASSVVFYAGGAGSLVAGGGGGGGGAQGGCLANGCGSQGGVGGKGGGTGGYASNYGADGTGGGAQACCDVAGSNVGNGGGGGGATPTAGGAFGGGSCCGVTSGGHGASGSVNSGGAGGGGGKGVLSIAGGGGGGGGGGGVYGGGGGGGGGNNGFSIGAFAARGGAGGGGGGSSAVSGAVSGITMSAGIKGGDGQVVVTWYQSSQTITFTSAPPSPALTGGGYNPTANGGGSGLPVWFSVSGACSLSGSTVYFTAAGSCVIRANQGGTAGYSPAPEVQQAITVILPDTTPPVVTPTVTGTLGNNGWYTSNVQVSWSVTDPESAISSSSGCGSSTVSTDTTGITFTCTATSVGGTASQSVTVKRDATAPAVTAAADRPADHNAWYNHALTVSFTGTDATSGIASCDAAKSYAGPDTSNGTVNGSCADQAGNTSSGARSFQYDATGPTVIAVPSRPADHNGWYNHALAVNFIGTDATSGIASCDAAKGYGGPDTTATTASGSCTDQAGNTNVGALTFKYDATAASVGYFGNAGSYTVDQSVSITCAAADNLSGVAASTCQNITGPAYSFNAGANAFSATATDKAGNTGGGSTLFTVQVTTGSLCTLVQRFVANQGIANSLCVKLDGAKAGKLGAFKNEVAAQSGKALTPAQAAILTRLAGEL